MNSPPAHHHHHSRLSSSNMSIGSTTSGGGFSSMGASGAYSVGSGTSQHTSSSQHHYDEAYRRLGHRLSRRAHGDPPYKRPQQLSQIGLEIGSCFDIYENRNTKNSNDSRMPPPDTMIVPNHQEEEVSEIILQDLGGTQTQTHDPLTNIHFTLC